MKTIIIDDDHSTAPFIEQVLIENFNEKIEGVAHDLSRGKELIEETQPDLIFLDINLPDGKGFELVNENSTFNIIFITAYDDYAVKAFEFAALDYLLKPLNPSRITEAYNRCKDSVNWREKYSVFHEHNSLKGTGSRMVLKTTEGYNFINIADIVFCESDGNYTRIFQDGQKPLLTSKTLRSIEALLLPQGFFRCHQSYLINLKYIEAYKSAKSQIELKGKQVVTLARSKKREFLELIESFGRE